MTMSPERVNGQRDVVKNERRQSYENAPYGMAPIEIEQDALPEGHPYHWPTIGYMEDLTAASYEDVVDFFRKYYQPANASLVVAGDIDPARTRSLVEKWFGDVKPGSGTVPPIDYPHAMLDDGDPQDYRGSRAASAPVYHVDYAAAVQAGGC